jgi:hypothetical protein
VLAPPVFALPLLLLALGCVTEPPSAPEATTPVSAPTSLIEGFNWGSATPESQGMCGTTRQLGCTKTMHQIWNRISLARHNTKRFVVIRIDKIVYDRGGTLPY